MLEINDLLLHRDSRFSLKIPRWKISSGEMCAVLGTNGAGKSTLLGLLSGELRAPGQVLLHGTPLEDWPSLERARHLAVLPQASAIEFTFTAEEVVSLGLTPLSLNRREGRRAVHELMRLTDCIHLKGQHFSRLSGGERQRVHLARVLVQLSQAERHPVLLLDEPTSAQDLGQQHRMLALTRTLAQEHGYCIAVTLHDLNLALRYTDTCLVLHRGQAVASGKPSDVISAATIQKYWDYPATVLTAAGGLSVVS